MKASESKKFMTAHDVSRYLRISLSTVHHLTRSGKLVSVKVGKQWRYEKNDIDLALEKSFGAFARGEFKGQDRRLFARRTCLVQGFAVISRGKEAAWIGEGTVLNVSHGGVLFEASEGVYYDPSAADTSIKLKLLLNPEHQKEFEVEGNIVRSDTSGKTRFGVRFKTMVPEIAHELDLVTRVN